MRGFNIHPASVDNSLMALHQYGAKLCRWQIARHDAHQLSMTDYQMWWNHEIGKVVSACDFLRDNNIDIKLIIDCHSPPGPIRNKEHGIIHNAHWRQFWCALWSDAAITLKDREEIAGFDIANEPWVSHQEKWLKVAEQCIKRIRAYDNDTWIYVSSKLGSPRFFKDMRVVEGRRVAYTCHYYLPKRITFGESDRVGSLTMSKVQRRLKHVIRFKREYHKKILIGEIGCSNNELIQKAFFSSALKVFNAHRFQWCVHAFREHPMWDYEGGEAMNVIVQRMNV